MVHEPSAQRCLSCYSLLLLLELRERTINQLSNLPQMQQSVCSQFDLVRYRIVDLIFNHVIQIWPFANGLI